MSMTRIPYRITCILGLVIVLPATLLWAVLIAAHKQIKVIISVVDGKKFLQAHADVLEEQQYITQDRIEDAREKIREDKYRR